MTNPDLNQKIIVELDKVNKVWQNLLENIHKKENHPRIKAILIQVMIEYYLDRMLILNGIIPKADVEMRYDQRLDELIKLNLIVPNFKDDLLKVYEIRNIYAHQIETHDQQILDLLNSVKTITDPSRFSDDEKYDSIVQILLRGVQRLFMEFLVSEQYKFDDKMKQDELQAFREIFG